MPGTFLLALFAGAALPLQAAINARLGRLLGSPVWAAAVSGAVLTVALVVIGLSAFRGLPRTAGASTLPWWAWTGGLCGAFVLSATTAVAPRIGTAAMIALVVAGQVICSLLLDHFGLFGLAIHPLSARRFAAAALLIAGAALISRS
jgi:transporter family-2 protein